MNVNSTGGPVEAESRSALNTNYSTVSETWTQDRRLNLFNYSGKFHWEEDSLLQERPDHIHTQEATWGSYKLRRYFYVTWFSEYKTLNWNERLHMNTLSAPSEKMFVQLKSHYVIYSAVSMRVLWSSVTVSDLLSFLLPLPFPTPFLDSVAMFPAGVQLGEMIALASPAPLLPL